MTLDPLPGYLVVKKADSSGKSAGGLILPSAGRSVYVVLACGKGSFEKPQVVDIGDKVIITDLAFLFSVDGVDYASLRYEDVMVRLLPEVSVA